MKRAPSGICLINPIKGLYTLIAQVLRGELTCNQEVFMSSQLKQVIYGGEDSRSYLTNRRAKTNLTARKPGLVGESRMRKNRNVR